MNNSIFESIFAVFDEKSPFLSILDTFWPIFGHFSYSTSINHSLTIELNNILNWILGKAILNRILNESFFGKIQILNWIRLGIVNHYEHPRQLVTHTEQLLAWRKVTIANSAATHATHLLGWKDTCWFTVERNPWFVHSATTLAQ